MKAILRGSAILVMAVMSVPGDTAERLVPSDTDPPASAATWVDARHVVPTWTATPRPMACIDAWFDEMMVNESAAPRAER
jgi:hypothetical protein